MRHLLIYHPHLGLPRRLTQLYTDTKTSYDAVIEEQDDQPTTQPEVNALHRKFRIQKDRLIAWGLEWSDKGTHEDIDEGVERAGLTGTVTSVLGTIKDILDEAERMHHMTPGQVRRQSREKRVG